MATPVCNMIDLGDGEGHQYLRADLVVNASLPASSALAICQFLPPVPRVPQFPSIRRNVCLQSSLPHTQTSPPTSQMSYAYNSHYFSISMAAARLSQSISSHHTIYLLYVCFFASGVIDAASYAT